MNTLPTTSLKCSTALLGLAVIGIGLGRFVPEACAQLSIFTPPSGVTIHQVWVLKKGDSIVSKDPRLFAMRGDGATVVAYRLKAHQSKVGWHQRHLSIPQQRIKVNAVEVTQTRTTQTFTNADLQVGINRRAAIRAANCDDSAFLLPQVTRPARMGEETLFGIRTFKYRYDHERGTSWYWRAPSLDCESIQEDHAMKDGHFSQKRIISVHQGEPDDALFRFSGLAEMSPQQLKRDHTVKTYGSIEKALPVCNLT
ncbi:MAG: hypothetical protein H7039_07430 [Bryobacteraceae bacterium]|nr:hypothetical protein [Bryobacteraceae bacterium]